MADLYQELPSFGMKNFPRVKKTQNLPNQKISNKKKYKSHSLKKCNIHQKLKESTVLTYQGCPDFIQRSSSNRGPKDIHKLQIEKKEMHFGKRFEAYDDRVSASG